jgi:hypothetical protein
MRLGGGGLFKSSENLEECDSAEGCMDAAAGAAVAAGAAGAADAASSFVLASLNNIKLESLLPCIIAAHLTYSFNTIGAIISPKYDLLI